MTVHINSRGQLSQAALKELSVALGHELPPEYAAFLANTNGGRPDDNVLADFRGDGQYGVSTFFGVTGRASDDILLCNSRYHHRIPSGCVAIADDECGNLFCLTCTDRDKGTVWFWDHEGEADEGKAPTFANMQMVARSFGEFIAALRKFDASHVTLDPREVKEVWIDPEFARMIDDAKKKKRP